MKRFAVILSVICLLFSVAGCENKKKDDDKGKADMGSGFYLIDEENLDLVSVRPDFEINNPAEKQDIFVCCNLFSDGAVLQRNAVNCIFGKTTESHVAVRINGKIFYGKVADHNFRVYTEPMESGGPFDMEIIGETGKHTIRNVYFGEVFLLSGQSNMAYRMQDSLRGDFGMHTGKYVPTRENDPDTYESYVFDSPKRNDMIKNYVLDQLDEADNSRLHLYGIPVEPEDSLAYKDTKKAENIGGNWKISDYENACGFSAVGFAFGQLLAGVSGDVHIGLVSASLGATFVPAWTPENVYDQNRDCFKYGGVYSDRDYNKAGKCYNRYISPIAGYRFRSVIWYQGEGQPEKYALSMEKMILGWRSDFGYEVPFLIIQLPRYGENDVIEGNYKPSDINMPSLSLVPFLIREEQKKICEIVPECIYSVNVDAGDYDELHPYDKKTVGERAAYKIIEKIYKKEGTWSGAYAESAEKKDGGVYVKFKNTGSGIVIKNDGRNIECAGKDNKFYAAECEKTSDDTIFITCSAVNDISYVRYGANNYPRITRNRVEEYMSLYTAEGFPVEQFIFEL